MFMTSGKYPSPVAGELRFVYSNDVWVVERP